MSFKKAFAKQDDQLAEIFAMQAASLKKINEIHAEMDALIANGKPIPPGDVKRLISVVQTLKARCNRYQHINSNIEFIGA